ncbi:MAG: hydroxyethylthiazole kinase [Chrysiogenia bacterium]
MTITAQDIFKDLEEVRRQAPLVHNITNYVVMNLTANALLAVGASPVMAHAPEEVEDMVNIASALVINIGTLSKNWIESMLKAATQAQKKGIPVIYDPVGAGATPYRTSTIHELLQAAAPTILRGNASEIMACAGAAAKTKGVDSASASEHALDSARRLNEEYGCVVCVSGATDHIIARKNAAMIKNGHAMMAKVTGLGCTATALCGAFAAVNPDYFAATTAAMAVMGMAGEMAAEKAKGPASMQVGFLDALFNMKSEDIQKRSKIS